MTAVNAMGSAPALSDEAVVTGPLRKRWSREEYYLLIDSGLIDRKRVQRIQGELLEMSPMKDRHAYALTLVDYALRAIFPPSSATIKIQCPMSIGRAHDPEPDLAVLAGAPRQQSHHPTSALLIVEVSDTSLTFDREIKAAIYAEAAVPDYWIVNLIDDMVEVHRNPLQEASGTYRYGDVRAYKRGETIVPLSAPQRVIAVNDFLP